MLMLDISTSLNVFHRKSILHQGLLERVRASMDKGDHVKRPKLLDIGGLLFKDSILKQITFDA